MTLLIRILKETENFDDPQVKNRFLISTKDTF